MTFGGHASDATVAAAYAESDVLVVTSEHEGYCVPVVEAMTVGLPVVAFRQGALPEVLGDGRGAGRLQGPLHALVDHRHRCCRDATLRARLAQQATRGWPSSTWSRRPTASSSCSAVAPERRGDTGACRVS